MKHSPEQNWSLLQVSAGILCVVLFGPGLLFSFVPGLPDKLLGSDALGRLSWGWSYKVVFGALFALGLFCFFYGLREFTRPPSVFYRLTHPRLPRRVSRRRPVWPSPWS
jgi:hypothetical protein